MEIHALWEQLSHEVTTTGLAISNLKLVPTGAHMAWGEVYLGLDAAGRRHVIVPAPHNATEESDKSSRGLTIEVKPFILGDNERLFCDISCQLEDLNRLFSVVAKDMIDALCAEPEASPFPVCLRVLERWRSLLNRAHDKLLSREKQAGLISELLLLNDLASISSRAINVWVGPEGARHDFVSTQLNIEVKSSTRPDERRVRIQSIEQLDVSDSQDLFLHYVGLREPTGHGVTIPSLIDKLIDKGVNSTMLYEKLGLIGYSPLDSDEYSQRPFELVERITFQVNSPGFPRLIPSSFQSNMPSGINKITYDIDLEQQLSEALCEDQVHRILSLMVKPDAS